MFFFLSSIHPLVCSYLHGISRMGIYGWRYRHSWYHRLRPGTFAPHCTTLVLHLASLSMPTTITITITGLFCPTGTHASTPTITQPCTFAKALETTPLHYAILCLQDALGEIVYVEFPEIGDEVDLGGTSLHTIPSFRPNTHAATSLLLVNMCTGRGLLYSSFPRFFFSPSFPYSSLPSIFRFPPLSFLFSSVPSHPFQIHLEPLRASRLQASCTSTLFTAPLPHLNLDGIVCLSTSYNSSVMLTYELTIMMP